MNLRILLFISFLVIFSFTASAQTAKSRTEPISIGATAPDFTLTDQDGKSVTLSQVGKATVLVFYRGYW